ncbi:MAG: agmatinase [Alphaproteobacteria bacterium]|nr:MAG: agmatinase [Alphaproteobacteria bacterium]
MNTLNLEYLAADEGFLGIDAKDAPAPENAQAVVVPFGLEASVSYGGGTAAGPAAIIKASHQVELFDEDLWCEPYRDIGIATLAPFPIADGVAGALDQIETVTESLLDAGKFPLVLGGEHSITAGVIRPFARRHDELAVLHFDAHADLRDGYDGEHYSHAAALRRVLDHDNIRLVSVGIRNISAEEIPFLESNRDRVSIHWAKDRARYDARSIAAELGDRPVFVTVDLDGFDSSLMPATGTPEPGGLFWQDVIDIVRETARTHRIVGADVMELAPIKGWHACDFLAAKLVYKILGYAFHKDKISA